MSKLDNATISRIESERTKVDVVACITSFVDAFACLIFLLWQTKLTNVGRSYIECIVDPVTCLIGYWGFYRRLHDTEAILADIGLTFLVLGTLSLSCQNAVEDLANLNSFSLQGDTPKQVGSFRLPVLSQFVTSELFTIYAIILSTAKTIWFLSPQRRSR